MKSGLRTALLLAAVAATGATACGPGVYWCACLPNVSPLRVCGTFLNRHGGRLDFRCRVVDGGWFSSAPYLGNGRSHHMLALLKKRADAGVPPPLPLTLGDRLAHQEPGPLHAARRSCNDQWVDDWVAVATSLLAEHPAVLSVEFAGSRSRGTHAELSDWDFAVETSDFDALARDLPALVAPLKPLAQQWEPMGHFPVYQVLLRGPTKIEYLFLTRSQEPLPALTPGPDTLAAINTHFWDWIWWLSTKASIGRTDLVAEHMPQLYDRLLRPLDVPDIPDSIPAAAEAFIARRNVLEHEYNLNVDRALENEVLQGIARVL